MRLFLQALTNLVIVCLSSTSKGGRGAFMWERRRIIWKAAVQNADVMEDGDVVGREELYEGTLEILFDGIL